MEVTKEQVDALQKEAEVAYQKLSLLKDAYYKAESEYIKKLNRFRELDHHLALIDGRLKKVPPGGERKVKKQPELTLEQLKTIAEKLGFDLTSVDEPEEENEEVVEAIMEEEEATKDEAQV
jgi:hypothetical protein